MLLFPLDTIWAQQPAALNKLVQQSYYYYISVIKPAEKLTSISIATPYMKKQENPKLWSISPNMSNQVVK